jgi:hypothetical protein
MAVLNGNYTEAPRAHEPGRNGHNQRDDDLTAKSKPRFSSVAAGTTRHAARDSAEAYMTRLRRASVQSRRQDFLLRRRAEDVLIADVQRAKSHGA